MNQPIRKRLFSGAATALALTKRRAASPMMRHAKPTSPTARSGRLVLTLLIMLLTTATAWADTETVSYIDADGHEQTVDATVLDGNGNTLNQGWYVVSSDVSYERLYIYNDAKIILKDNCTMTVNYDADPPLYLSSNLTIYGQSGGTGKLVVNSSYSKAIKGLENTFTVNGGIVESKSTHTLGCALSCGALVFNGGKLKLEGCDGIKGRSNTSQSVTLNWRNATDRVYISSFNYIGSVTVGGAGGKCFADAEGNYYGGTYTDNFSALAGKELQPATAYTLTLGSGITAEPLFTYSDVAYYAGTVTLGHADRDGLLRWISQFKKKPSFVFVNHGDDDSCTAFSQSVTEHFSIPSSAPYSGSEFDLLTGEWIRLTDPVYKKKTTNAGERVPAEKKRSNTDYLALKNALLDLSMYIDQLSNHSNGELRDLTQKIRALISDQA